MDSSIIGIVDDLPADTSLKSIVYTPTPFQNGRDKSATSFVVYILKNGLFTYPLLSRVGGQECAFRPSAESSYNTPVRLTHNIQS
jgi:hypothetical protein